MELYDALDRNCWVRSFRTEQLNNEQLNHIQHFMNYFNHMTHFESVRGELLTEQELKAQTGLNLITKAPHYFVVRMEETKEGLINAGYLQGQLAMYLFTKDIRSCVLGVERVKKTERETKDTWIAIMAIGYSNEKKRAKRKRKSYIKKKQCIFKQEDNNAYRLILDAGSFAPHQSIYHPYRFIIFDKRIHVFISKELFLSRQQQFYFRNELGLMLAFMQYKAEELWYGMSVSYLPRATEQSVKKFVYMVTIELNLQ